VLLVAALALAVLALVLVERRAGAPAVVADPIRTPGVLNPDVTQATIGTTICVQGWTRTVRPPTDYTNALKRRQMRAYGESGPPSGYQEDHLISLELGGHPTDPRNLWPEPYQTSIGDGGAHYKDKVENYLHDQVCAGRVSLQDAQHEIATDWYRVYTTSVPH